MFVSWAYERTVFGCSYTALYFQKSIFLVTILATAALPPLLISVKSTARSCVYRPTNLATFEDNYLQSRDRFAVSFCEFEDECSVQESGINIKIGIHLEVRFTKVHEIR